ncbi:insulinase family protein [Lactobacillus sp. DCY120]|uniref:Insulinase family protein n=1 Tax=Bombilactobacillus apium TaxID=2675299 RepID=A0A850R799_9LACO|nr:insulinase family protein [Bombilactobacillus apium]NVY96532.1 insulinase family protein [Bombilactobacillus apium]
MVNYSHSVSHLDNGLVVYQRSFPGSPLAGVTCKIHLNSQYQNGLPHLIEHLLVHQIPRPDWIKISGSTTAHFIALQILGEKAAIADFLPNYWKQFQHFQVTSEQLEREKAVVQQELRHYQASLTEKFATQARGKMFDAQQPYHDEVLGNIQDLATIKTADITDFCEKQLTPKQVTFLIAGDCSQNPLDLLKVWSQWPTQATVPPTSSSDSPALQTEPVILGDPQTAQIAHLSLITPLTTQPLPPAMILALSLTFSLLQTGPSALLQQLHQTVPQLYMAQPLPLYRGSQLYLQILSACAPNDAPKTIKGLQQALAQLKTLQDPQLTAAFRALTFQQDCLFDGVASSLAAFARMDPSQEKIVSLTQVHRKAILKSWQELTTTLASDQQPYNILLKYQ